MLVAGEAGQVEGGDVEKLSDVNPNTMAWKTGEFIFEDTPLLQALKDLKHLLYQSISGGEY